MHPVPGTITWRPGVRPKPAAEKRRLARKARSFGASPRQLRDRLNGFSKD